MYYTPVAIYPRKLAKKLRKRTWKLPNDKMNNDSKKDSISKSTSSIDSKLKIARASIATFSSGIYSYHANPSQKFNLTMDTTTETDAELRIEASFWVSIIFMVFLCSVITAYCIFILREDKISSEQIWENTHFNSENNQACSSHSKAVIITDNSKGPTSILNEVSKDIKTFASNKLKGGLNHSISADSHTMRSLEISNTSCESEHVVKNVPKHYLNGAVMYTEKKKKKHCTGDKNTSRKPSRTLAWQLETKPIPQSGSDSLNPVGDRKFPNMEKIPHGFR